MPRSSAVHVAVEAFAARADRLDVLVNNAGGFGTHGPFATRGQVDMDAVVAMTLSAVLYTTHAARRRCADSAPAASSRLRPRAGGWQCTIWRCTTPARQA